MTTKKTVAILTLIAAFAVNSFAANPTTELYLKTWTQVWKPIWESCLSTNCGRAFDIHPERETIASTYFYELGLNIKTMRVDYVSPPVIQRINVTSQYWRNDSTNNNLSIADLADTSNNTTNHTVDYLPSLSVTVQPAYGNYTFATNHADYSDTETITETSSTKFRVNGGSTGSFYTYRINMRVAIWRMDQAGEPYFFGFAPYNQIHAGPNQQAASDGGNYWGYINLTVAGGLSNQIFDVTPNVSGPYFYKYEINVTGPTVTNPK